MNLGDAPRDEGINRVTGNTPEEFKEAFNYAIEFLMSLGEPFNCDDVWPLIKERPHHPNAWGALFNAAVRWHKLVKAGTRKIIRPEGHSRMTPLHQQDSLRNQ